MNIGNYMVRFLDGEDYRPMEVILYQDKTWLVPKWEKLSDRAYATPERIIDISKMPTALINLPLYGTSTTLDVDLPAALLTGKTQADIDAGYTVIFQPDFECN